MDDGKLCLPHLKGNINSLIKFINCAMFPENKTEKRNFPLSIIKKFHAEIVFVAWLRDLSWEVEIVYLFFKKTLLENSQTFCYFICLFFDRRYRCICYYFRWMLWPFLRARASQLVYSSLSSFFAWCRAKVCRSGSKDICTLQKAEENYRGEPHEILVKCFKNFVYPWFARRKKQTNSERHLKYFIH